MLDEALRRHQAGRESDARALYERVLSIEPANALALHYLGMIHWRDGSLDKAESMVRQSIECSPGVPDFHNNLGLCLNSLWRHDEAIAEYRKALALQPDYVQACNNLGLSLQQIGDGGGAIECFRRAVELAPDFAEALRNLELALRATNGVHSQ